MLEGIICPVCENTLEEVDLRDSLVCPHCRADLKDRKFLDFLEYLMANGIVESLNFFDTEVYSEELMIWTRPKKRRVIQVNLKRKKITIIFMKMNFFQKIKLMRI